MKTEEPRLPAVRCSAWLGLCRRLIEARYRPESQNRHGRNRRCQGLVLVRLVLWSQSAMTIRSARCRPTSEYHGSRKCERLYQCAYPQAEIIAAGKGMPD